MPRRSRERSRDRSPPGGGRFRLTARQNHRPRGADRSGSRRGKGHGRFRARSGSMRRDRSPPRRSPRSREGTRGGSRRPRKASPSERRRRHSPSPVERTRPSSDPSPPPDRSQRSPSNSAQRQEGSQPPSPIPIATLPKAKAAPRPAEPPVEGSTVKRKKRRRKEKMNDEDAPGVTPKASAPAPPEVASPQGGSDEEAPVPSAPPQVETKPKRRAKTKARAGGDRCESRVEAEPLPDVKEGKEVKEGQKRRKKRRHTEAKEEEAEVKPEGEVPIDDQAALIATVEELAPVPEEGPPKRRRKRKRHPEESAEIKEPSNGERSDHPEVNNARYGELIRGVYQRHNPAKLNEVESLLQKYEGMEAELYHRVCEKYQEKPQDVDGEADGEAGGASAKAPPSRVMAGAAWPFEEDEVSVNSESSSSEAPKGSNPPVEEPPKNNLPPSGIFDVVGPVDNKSPSSWIFGWPSSKRSGDDLMQRFTSLTEPSKAPGNGAEIPRGDVAPPRPATLPAWAFAPVVPPERGTGAAGAERPEFQSNGRNPQEPAIPAWALPEDAPPGDWGSRRYPPSYPGRGAPGGPGPPGWGGKGWGYPGYAALPMQAAPGRSWADNIGSAWAQ